MKHCPNCQNSVADHISFCPKCGTSIPTPAPKTPDVPKSAPEHQAPKSKKNNGLTTALWVSLVANLLICALLISCTLGLFGPMAQYRKLEERMDAMEAQLATQDEDRLSGTPAPTDPTSTVPTSPVPSQSTDTKPSQSDTQPDATDPQPTEPPKEQFTITVWAPAEDQIAGNDWLREMQYRFEERNPQYDITWVNDLVSEGDAGWRVSTDPGAAADIYMFANDQMYTLVQSGGLSQLSGTYLQQVQNDNTQFAVNTVTYTDGGVYGFPMAGNTWFMYYNKDVFTPEDVKSLDTMLVKGRVCVPFTVSWNSGCFFLGCGGTMFGPKGNDSSADIDFGGQKGYTAAKKMIEIANNPNCVPGGMDIGMLIDGAVGAAFSGSWDAYRLQEALGDKLGIAKLPTFEANGKTYNMTALSGSKCVGVNPCSGATKNKQKLCTEFAAFLASEEGQLLRYELRRVIPIHKNLANNAKIKSDPIAMAEIQTLADCSVVQPGIPEMSNYWTPMDTFGRGIVNGDITMENYMNHVDLMNEALNLRGW